MEVVDAAKDVVRTILATLKQPGGRGNGGRRRGKGRGKNYTGNTQTTKKGMNKALGGIVFDYGQKAAAYQMRTSWEKVTEYVGTTYGQDISNKLQNKVTGTLAEPAHEAGTSEPRPA